MKREKTLRQGLIFFLVLALILPMLCFAFVSQFMMWKVANSNMHEIINNDIRGMDTTLNLILDKYHTVLYDFCADEDIIRLIGQINKNQDGMDAGSLLRRELVQICEGHEGVEGITLITANGKVFFYDRLTASSHISSWAGQVAAPEIKQGVMYRQAREVIHAEDAGSIYLYQIGRNVKDIQDLNRGIGTVILSVNTDTLDNVFSVGKNSEAFISENGRILASSNPSYINQEITAVKKGSKMIRNMVNEKSGWTIHDYHSRDMYVQALWGQALAGGGLTIVMIVLLVSFVWHITNPMLDKVEGLVTAMNRVEDGDFSVRISSSGRIPEELRRIVDGFNRMVGQLEKLIKQVKQSAVDQKNAEISAMEAQIDPHFLYNTLDTINWKAIEREEYEISSMVGILADILRYSIRDPGDTASLGQVLYWMEQYTTLQSKKLDAPLVVEVDVPEELKNYRIHKLLLQPFVENAIRHGFWQKKEECRLKVTIRKTEDQLHIIVKDNGKGIAPELLERINDTSEELSGHVGIQNVRMRLKLYYGEDATVYFESREGRYTKAHLFVKALPYKEDKRENSSSRG